MDAAKERDMLIVFDRNTKKFYIDSEEIEIRDKVIFPRSFISTEKELLNQLEENGALSIQTKEDLGKIMNWPQKFNQYIEELFKQLMKIFKITLRNINCFSKTFF